MKREELKCQSKRLQLIAVLSAPTQNYEVVQTIPLMSACTLELGCLTVYVYIWASNFEEWLYCPYIFFIFPLDSFSHYRDSQLTASSSYQPSLVGPSKVHSWMKGPSKAHPVYTYNIYNVCIYNTWADGLWDACIKAVTRGCHHLPK